MYNELVRSRISVPYRVTPAMKAFIGIVIIFTMNLVVQSEHDSVRHTTSGSIQGLRKRVLERNVDVFLGIPYAEPPVGQRRFHNPKPIAPWGGKRDAKTLPPACNQKSDEKFADFGTEIWHPNSGVSEDCLYLNIWQPLGGEPNKATMIWIYGGAFNHGSSTLAVYDGAYLAAQGDVIVVSMQYRVGPFGFLHLYGAKDGDAAQGNMGLMDQSLAIKWYSNNADRFGGDKNRITLFGASSGAVNVDHHMLSPMSKDLFQSAIMQSGNALVPQSCDYPELATQKALTFGRLLNCNFYAGHYELTSQQRSDLIECLQNIPASELAVQQFNVTFTTNYVSLAFVPTIDGRFITQPPKYSLYDENSRKGKPILTGVVKDEGTYFLADTQPSNFPLEENPAPITEEQYKNGVLAILSTVDSYYVSKLADDYMKSEDDKSYRDLLANIFGDGLMKCPVQDVAVAHSGFGGDVYLYEYAHSTSINSMPNYMGVMHGYEIDHVFGHPLNQSLNYTSEERSFSEDVIKYWTNFAKSGNPNLNGDHGLKDVEVEWPKYNSEDKKFLSLGASSIQVQSGFRDKACPLWADISKNDKCLNPFSISVAI